MPQSHSSKVYYIDAKEFKIKASGFDSELLQQAFSR